MHHERRFIVVSIPRGKMDVAILNVCVLSKLSKNERFILSPVFFYQGSEWSFYEVKMC